MATTTRRLTSAPQSRKQHKVYRNGKLVRVYYTDSGKDTGGGTKTIKGKGVKHFKGNTWAPTQQMINEFRSYGRQFIQQKYKLSTARLNYLSAAINKAVNGKTAPAAQQGFIAAAGRMKDGGPMEGSPDNPMFARKMMLNLENDSDLAQGSHHQWAQPTSISSLITSQLRQAQNAPADYFEAWAKDKGGTTQLLARDSSSFGIDAIFTPDAQVSSHDDEYDLHDHNMDGKPDHDEDGHVDEENISQYGPMTMQAESDPMGAFSTQMVMNPFYGQDQEDGGTMHTMGAGQYTPVEIDPGPEYDPSDQLKNPWGFGYGGAMNGYGPSAQTMATATMEAMALANAYFAPQRMELAYQLGDMETDMRRLAVNLGRQVDDPVLQAKLYKEGMRAVRTMDVQQNTMAFQMAEQRRREELQNFQFYDSLAQQEYFTRLQNQQYYSTLNLQGMQYNLQRDQLSMMIDQANPPQPKSDTAPETVPLGQNPPPAQDPKKLPSPAPMPLKVGPGNLL